MILFCLLVGFHGALQKPLCDLGIVHLIHFEPGPPHLLDLLSLHTALLFAVKLSGFLSGVMRLNILLSKAIRPPD